MLIVQLKQRWEKSWRMLSLFIIDSLIYFSVSRSTPPCLLWFSMPLAHSKSSPLPSLALSRSPPITPLSRCSVLAPSVSCHVRLSSWSRRGSRVSKRTVNFPGWRWHPINNSKHRHTDCIMLLDQKGGSYAKICCCFFLNGVGHQLVDDTAARVYVRLMSVDIGRRNLYSIHLDVLIC